MDSIHRSIEWPTPGTHLFLVVKKLTEYDTDAWPPSKTACTLHGVWQRLPAQLAQLPASGDLLHFAMHFAQLARPSPANLGE